MLHNFRQLVISLELFHHNFCVCVVWSVTIFASDFVPRFLISPRRIPVVRGEFPLNEARSLLVKGAIQASTLLVVAIIEHESVNKEKNLLQTAGIIEKL